MLQDPLWSGLESIRPGWIQGESHLGRKRRSLDPRECCSGCFCGSTSTRQNSPSARRYGSIHQAWWFYFHQAVSLGGRMRPLLPSFTRLASVPATHSWISHGWPVTEAGGRRSLNKLCGSFRAWNIYIAINRITLDFYDTCYFLLRMPLLLLIIKVIIIIIIIIII